MYIIIDVHLVAHGQASLIHDKATPSFNYH